MSNVRINESISEQLERKLKSSIGFKKKIDAIMNGQIILYIKHGKINTRRFIDDDNFDEKED